MIKRMTAALLLTLAMVVTADNVLYTWDAPTTNTDGSALAAEDIIGYQLRYSVDGIDYPIITIAGQSEITIPAVAGEWTAQVAAMTSAGISAWSDAYVLTIGPIQQPLPSAPTNINLLIQCSTEGCTMEIK